MRFVSSLLIGATLLLGVAWVPSTTPLPSADGFSVVVYGDSLTVGASPAASYPNHWPPDWARVNRGAWSELGVTGQIRLRRAIPDLVEHDVDVVVLSWGTTDAYSPHWDERRPTSWRDEFVAEIAESLDKLLAAGITPVVAFPPPILDASPAGALANQRLEDLEWLVAVEAAARDVAFVDLFGALLDEPDPSAYFEDDGIFLNADGAAFAARQIEAAVAPVYAEAARRRAP